MIQAENQRSIVEKPNNRNRCRTDLESQHQIERRAEIIRNRRAQWIAMTDNRDNLVGMFLSYLFQLRYHPSLHVNHPFTARSTDHAASCVEKTPTRVTLEFFEGLSFPFTEPELAEAISDPLSKPMGSS
jgi:hypothetical protein